MCARFQVWKNGGNFVNCLHIKVYELCMLPISRVGSNIFTSLMKKTNLTFLSPGQTIARCQRNISQHCWAQHVACVWPPCCDVLQHVGCCWLKFETGQIWGNNTQHVATWWPNANNTLLPTMLRYVVLTVLLSFGRGFIYCTKYSILRNEFTQKYRTYHSLQITGELRWLLQIITMKFN